ncbi:hypothetical protein BHE74_00029640 [Ensete ventricosum]|nr:hypothetical protein BHE74_00029640 [Ensete ventricosum]RZR98456.1 hypothetical protein BHM03_00027787 [Ensete ventricosum]
MVRTFSQISLLYFVKKMTCDSRASWGEETSPRVGRSVMHMEHLFLLKQPGQCKPPFQNMWLHLQQLLDQCFLLY